MVFVVDTSLQMGKGKIAAQVGHTCVAATRTLIAKHPRLFRAYSMHGQTKIVVKGRNGDDLTEVERQAREAGKEWESATDRETQRDLCVYLLCDLDYFWLVFGVSF